MTSIINTINCKNCDAHLKVLGNIHRAKSLSCEYCGTVMDTQQTFKALYAFTQIQKPNTDLRIGMDIVLRDISFKITGHISYKSRNSEWIEFLLYSPQHGYARLIRKDSRYLFLRKTHYLPDTNIWMLKQGDCFTVRGKEYVIEEFHFAQMFHAAGSLIQTVKQGKRNKQCFAWSGKHCFVSIQNGRSVDYFVGFELSEGFDSNTKKS